MQDNTTLAVPALGLPVDGLSEVVRMAVRGAIEQTGSGLAHQSATSSPFVVGLGC